MSVDPDRVADEATHNSALSALGWLLGLADSAPVATLAAVSLGIGNGLSNGWIQCVGADFAPKVNRAQFLGTWNLLMNAGNLTGPLLAGLIAHWFSLTHACFAISAICMLGSGWYAFCCVESHGFSAMDEDSKPML